MGAAAGGFVLTEHHRREYAEQGYTVFEACLPPPLITALRDGGAAADALLAFVHISLLRVLCDAAAATEAAAIASGDARRVPLVGHVRWNRDLDLTAATWPEILRLAILAREEVEQKEAFFIATAHCLADHPY
jgi:hypothetical protein